ncbi:MAG: hypothetical protein H0U67_06930 [Gemmatimonadetes bacterium]|nr:hypothetical protein [Gemmatimonadota bacterium]
MTNAIEVAELSTAADRQEMAEGILSLLQLDRQARELRAAGFEIGISCQKEGITASATPAGGTAPTLTARVNVAEWWDPKQLSNDEWSRQLAHALAAALRAAGKRAMLADDRARYEYTPPGYHRLRLQVPVQPGRGFRMAR